MADGAENAATVAVPGHAARAQNTNDEPFAFGQNEQLFMNSTEFRAGAALPAKEHGANLVVEEMQSAFKQRRG